MSSHLTFLLYLFLDCILLTRGQAQTLHIFLETLPSLPQFFGQHPSFSISLPLSYGISPNWHHWRLHSTRPHYHNVTYNHLHLTSLINKLTVSSLKNYPDFHVSASPSTDNKSPKITELIHYFYTRTTILYATTFLRTHHWQLVQSMEFEPTPLPQTVHCQLSMHYSSPVQPSTWYLTNSPSIFSFSNSPSKC